MSKKWIKHLDNEVCLGLLHKEGDLYISNEFPDREYDSQHYSDVWEKRYEDVLIKLIQDNIGPVDSALDVGAGFGGIAYKFIKAFEPKEYCAYEFSSAHHHITKPKDSSTNLIVNGESFKDLPTSVISKYDIVISTETLEHINWDIEFIKSIPTSKWLAITIPTFLGCGHIRSYPLMESIEHRYGEYLDIVASEWVGNRRRVNYPKWWAFIARRK